MTNRQREDVRALIARVREFGKDDRLAQTLWQLSDASPSFKLAAASFLLSKTDPDLLSSVRDLEQELVELRRRVTDEAAALGQEKEDTIPEPERIADLDKALNELGNKETISSLLRRLHPSALKNLLASEGFRRQFLETKECNAFIMAIDIRRSTELMLKARTPEAFVAFIKGLCSSLMDIITESYGVVDKFTGDGVLAFFPDFYSGSDAGYHVVSAADRCHASFSDHYKRSRKSFSSVLTDVGLGIGIDYGSVHLVQIAPGLTVVGAPVVYACRLSGAPAGMTLVNQPAFEVISDTFGANCSISETELEIKHEGSMLAYNTKLNERKYQPRLPNWAPAAAKTVK